ncbi:MAG: PAS domain-containing protein [Desulfobacteraceae bacterium]|nr:PAS domain-containing protein [Desulfobacteraceae bacterium]
MKYEAKTKEQLINKLMELRLRIVELEEVETECKHIEDKIRKLIRVGEHSSRMLMITDISATIEYINPTFARVIRYTFEEIVGKNAENLEYRASEERKRMWEVLEVILENR